MKPIVFMASIALAAAAAVVTPSIASAQSEGAAGRAATGLAGQTVRRIFLPAAAVLAVVESAEAREEHCQFVPEDDVFACTLNAFGREQVEELAQLGHDVSDVMRYIVVPNVQEFWDENGDDIMEGAAHAAEVAADAAVVAGDYVWDNTPRFLSWVGEMLESE